MSADPVNNPPIPVKDGVTTPPLTAEEECEKLKLAFGVQTGSHKENTSGSTKLNNRDYQSHHFLQDAATNPLIPRPQALAIMLADSHSGTEHGTITQRQNERMRNKTNGSGGATPGTTLGAVKKQARDDFVKGMTGRRKNKDTGDAMTAEEAEKLAKCIEAEADKKIKDEAEKNDKDPPTDASPVAQPGGCFPDGTLIWLADHRRIAVERLRPGDLVAGTRGPQRVVRVDRCHHDLLELFIGGERIVLATFHRLRTAGDQLVRADECRVGDRVTTASGERRIDGVRAIGYGQPVHRVALDDAALGLVGALGVGVYLPESGPPMLRTETVHELREHAQHAEPAR